MFHNAERKEVRLHQMIREGQEVSARTYNMVLGGSNCSNRSSCSTYDGFFHY